MILRKQSLTAPWFVLALVTFAIHLLVNGGYGIFRDELYFIVCGRRLDWGYVDQPPLVPLIAAWSYAFSGDWLTGFRFLPALVLAATVALTADFARVLGGGRFAQSLAGLCALCCPSLLAQGVFLTTDLFQPITWLGLGYALVRLDQTKDQRWWLAIALIAAFSLWSKYAIIFFIVGLIPGLLLTPLRKSFAKPYIYLAAALALLLVLPNILWQANHHWPFLELGSAGVHGKNRVLSSAAFFGQQLLIIGPLLALVWIAGLWRMARHESWRAFPVAYLVLAVFFITQHGKAGYMMPIYPILFAGGALFWEELLKPVWARGLVAGLVALSGILLAPLAMPVLPEESYIAYADALGISPKATAGENLKLSRLPQHFADMHGWPEMAAKISAAFARLTPEERKHAIFYGDNYGEAAAVDVLAKGLPPARSGHNNYWLWGPGPDSAPVVIEIGGTREEHLRDFASVEQAGFLDDPYAMPYETNQPIWIERGFKHDLQKIWPRLKHYE
ncbi:hypothetical protein FHS83_000646 [Rhizomicrobium palustre]|uniref:Glycosyltransferase RgtA/B/C/D-like domain-containing protein n=1 Tax=Rhizomicrobium palustre TaxID=189966 RepID=A0A846MUX7_9PROT|nr:glycosyltransferase family 39 protein [Rhizomicrobium palustre]NIK87328.1 hypothetical protein [Rhizomicrobium palustre]